MTVKRNLMPSIKRLAEFLGFLLVQANYSLGFELSFKFYGAICCGNVARSVKCRPNVDYWQSCLTGISLASQVKINSPSCTFFLFQGNRLHTIYGNWQAKKHDRFLWLVAIWSGVLTIGYLFMIRCSKPLDLEFSRKQWSKQTDIFSANFRFNSESNRLISWGVAYTGCNLDKWSMGASAASDECFKWCQLLLPWLSRKCHQVRRCLRKKVVGRQTLGNNRPRLFLFAGCRESSAGVTSAAWGNQAGNHDHWNNAESRPIKTVEPHHFIDFAFTLNGFRHRNAGRRRLSVEPVEKKFQLIQAHPVITL